MTREEAIARIRIHKNVHKMDEPRAINISEALDMAIKALEQKPCEDCISRKAVIDVLTKTSGVRGDALRALYDLPTVTPKQEPNTWSLDDAREDFIYDVYKTLESLPTNDEANRIIDSFDRVTSGIRCDDAISRQQAIDKMQELEDEDIESYGCAIPEGFDGERAIEALNTLPSIQPIAKMVDPQESEAEYRLPHERNIIISPIMNGYALEREIKTRKEQ